MRLSIRFALVAALAGLALAGCNRSTEEAPSDPRPPAEAPPPPAAPDIPPAAPDIPPPAGEEEAPAEQAEAPAEGEEAAAEGAAEGEDGGAQVSAEAQAEADQLWTTLCSTCHGMEGEGDGPVAASFPVKPRSFSDQAWQDETTDENIAKVILEGGAAIGKSPLMPGNPQLNGKPEVVQALVQKVRSFGDQ